MELPLVSILAVCYNQSKFIEKTLDSVKNQTYKNIQLVIIDDCSTDNSVDIINNWIKTNSLNCVFIPNNKNIGVCKSVNKAFAYCNGKYFHTLSCDDIILPEKIEKQVELLESTGPEVGMVFSDAYFIDEEGESLYGLYIQQHRHFLKVPSGNIFEILLEVNFIPSFSVLIKREIFEKIGPWDEDLDYEDTDMWIRIAKEYQIIYSEFNNCRYRIHDGNFHTKIYFEINRFKYLFKHANESKKAQEEMLKILLFSYWGNHKPLSYMRKVYFSVTNNSRILNYFIIFRIPYIFYFVISKLFKLQ